MKQAFTLVELLLSMSLLALIAAVTAPVLNNFQANNDLQLATDTYVQTLHRAQSNARAGKNDSAWGVKLQGHVLTIFKGNSYAARDSSFDEVYTLSSRVFFSGSNEMVFAKFSGLPSATGSTTFSVTGNSHTIVINSLGTVNY